jgi:hypothetical protein
MQDFLHWAWYVVSTSAVSLLVVTYLGKRIIDHRLGMALQTHKDHLRREADVELERIRAVAGIAKAEHEIMLTRLQEKRARVIGSLYAKLVTAVDATQIFVITPNPDSSEESARIPEKVQSAWRAASRYFDRQRVWLPKECCDTTEIFLERLQSAFWDRLTFKETEDGGAIGEYRTDYDRKSAWQLASAEIPAMLESLAHQMRILLDPRIPSRKQ